MKGVILVFATLMLSAPLHAETIALPGTGTAVAVKIVKMCKNQGKMIQMTFPAKDVHWLKCGVATEFTVIQKGDSVTVTGNGPMVQEMFEGLK